MKIVDQTGLDTILEDNLREVQWLEKHCKPCQFNQN